MTDKLAKEYRKRGKTVGIIAIDPTSPFSGGAILGDRIRMLDLTADEGIFLFVPWLLAGVWVDYPKKRAMLLN